MQRTGINTHHGLGLPAGTCQLNQAGAAAQVDQFRGRQQRFFAAFRVVFATLGGRWTAHQTHADSAGRAVVHHHAPMVKRPDLGAARCSGMDQHIRHIEVGGLPGQFDRLEIGVDAGQSAEQLSDVVTAEMVSIALQKFGAIPIEVPQKALMGCVTPRQVAAFIGGETSTGHPGGVQLGREHLGDWVESVEVDGQINRTDGLTALLQDLHQVQISPCINTVPAGTPGQPRAGPFEIRRDLTAQEVDAGLRPTLTQPPQQRRAGDVIAHFA